MTPTPKKGPYKASTQNAISLVDQIMVGKIFLKYFFQTLNLLLPRKKQKKLIIKNLIQAFVGSVFCC